MNVGDRTTIQVAGTVVAVAKEGPAPKEGESDNRKTVVVVVPDSLPPQVNIYEDAVSSTVVEDAPTRKRRS